MANPLLLNELAGRTWAMHRPRLEHLLRAARDGVVPATLTARSRAASQTGSVRVISVQGPLDSKDSFFLELFGGTSYANIRQNLRDALADTSVSGIVFLCDSPGGTTDGLPELADEIYKARGKKPMSVVVDGMCCSAAFWLMSQADEIIVSKYSAYVGSVGVYAEHEDYSRALDQAGIAITLISAGEGKTDGHPALPLSDEAKSEMQARVDEVYGFFVDAVSRGRGVKASAIRSEWGARVFGSKDAIRLGLASRIGTIDDAIVRIGGSSSGRTRASVSQGPIATQSITAADSGIAARDQQRRRLAAWMD